MLELLVEVLGEFVLQVIGEALFELGLHALAEPFRRPPTPWLAAFGFALFGAVAGGLSLLAFPAHLTPPGLARLANLLLTPIAVGLCMGAMGAWRTKRGDTLLRVDTFSYGSLFAFSLALVRFLFAR